MYNNTSAVTWMGYGALVFRPGSDPPEDLARPFGASGKEGPRRPPVSPHPIRTRQKTSAVTY